MRSNSIIYFLLTTFLFSTSAFASPVTVSISGDQTVHVGDKVRLNIFYSADPSVPIFTTSADLQYDNSAFSYPETSFSSDWLPISKSPYELTEPGHVVRTAGFPSGFSGNTRFLTISFIAKKTGPTTINLSGGMALDSDNNDLGVASKSFIVNVLGNQPEELKPQTQPISQSTEKLITTKPLDIKIPAPASSATTTPKQVEIQVAKLSPTGELKFDTENLPEGDYVVIIKSATSTKKDKNILEKRIQIVKDVETNTQVQKQENLSWLAKVFRFFGLTW